MDLRAPPWHEFYLRDTVDNNPAYRVAIGRLIDAKLRRQFQPPAENGDKSGEIGFMDVYAGDRNIPVDDPKTGKLEKREALVIRRIWVETSYEGKGVATMLVMRAAEIAAEWGLDTVVAIAVDNKNAKSIFKKEGYRPYLSQFIKHLS